MGKFIIIETTRRGAIAGAVLSTAYATLVIPLVGVWLVVSNLPHGKGLDALWGAMAWTVCAWPFAFVLGILPGVILGAMVGLVMGLIIAPLRCYLSPRRTAMIGFIMAVLLIVGAHLILGSGLIAASPYGGFARFLPYLFWLAGPSVLVILELTWVGFTARLYSNL